MIFVPMTRKAFAFLRPRRENAMTAAYDLDEAFLSMCRDAGVMSDEEWQAAMVTRGTLPPPGLSEPSTAASFL
jgi:hypothetical protein